MLHSMLDVSNYTQTRVTANVCLLVKHLVQFICLTRSSIVGYAPVGSICKYGGGYSVNEDRGFHSWVTAAHELGHK